MSKSVRIGVWIEKEPRDLTRCPSYYAADHETIRTRPGEYPVMLVYESGYTIPMPYWLCIGIQGDRISGALYSGFCGNNFAKTDLPLEPAVYTIQAYSYELRRFVEDGRVKLDPGREWLLDEHPTKSPQAPKTWAEVI